MDRENVVGAFEKIISVCKEDGCDFVDLTFEDAEQILALLKEQDGKIKTLEDKNAKLMLLVNEYLKKEREEAVEPKVEKAILDYQSWHYICGDCGGQIDINDNYCRHCGRVVAHLSNKI